MLYPILLILSLHYLFVVFEGELTCAISVASAPEVDRFRVTGLSTFNNRTMKYEESYF